MTRIADLAEPGPVLSSPGSVKNYSVIGSCQRTGLHSLAIGIELDVAALRGVVRLCRMNVAASFGRICQSTQYMHSDLSLGYVPRCGRVVPFWIDGGCRFFFNAVKQVYTIASSVY